MAANATPFGLAQRSGMKWRVGLKGCRLWAGVCEYECVRVHDRPQSRHSHVFFFLLILTLLSTSLLELVSACCTLVRLPVMFFFPDVCLPVSFCQVDELRMYKACCQIWRQHNAGFLHRTAKSGIWLKPFPGLDMQVTTQKRNHRGCAKRQSDFLKILFLGEDAFSSYFLLM